MNSPHFARGTGRARLVLSLAFLTLCVGVFAGARPATACAGANGPLSEEIGPLLASQQPVSLVVDGQAVTPNDVPLFIKNNRLHGELSSIFTALGLDLGWQGAPLYRITATQSDLELEMHLGCQAVAKTIYGKNAGTITMDSTPFLAVINGVATNRTVVPVSFVASATGAEVAWNGATRTVTITSGRTYFFDWNGTAGTYIHYTDARFQEAMECPAGFALESIGPTGGRWCASSTEAHGPFSQAMIDACGGTGACLGSTWNKNYAESLRGEGLCPVGTTFDTDVKYCVETVGGVEQALGPFPQRYRDRCLAYASSSTCNGDQWPTSILPQILDTADVSAVLTSSEVVDIFESNNEVFGIPLENNDLVSHGLFSPDGARDGNGNGGDFVRSEDPLPPFVLSGRRQTDSLVRTAYLLLPPSVRQSTAFLLPDKVAQNPSAYIPYIQKKQKAMVIGALMGPGGIQAVGDAKNQAVLLRQERELFKLRTTLALLDSLNVPVDGVFYSIGDTVKLDPGAPNAAAVNAEMDRIAALAQTRVDRILDAAGLSSLKRPLSFGGDELVHVAFARALGVTYDVYVEIQDPNVKPRYDGGRTMDEIVNAKLAEIGLNRVYSPTGADMEYYVFSRAAGDTSTFTAADQAFVNQIDALSASRRARTVISDARLHNGALDPRSAPAACDFLTWTGWGTGGNNVGFALAQAKILLYANSPINAKRLFLEAVAHDVYANGYTEVQWNSTFKSDLTKDFDQGGCEVAFNHHPGYTPEQADNVYCLFNKLTTRVSQRMLAQYPSCIPAGYTEPFKVTAQLWRTFESEVRLWPTQTGSGAIFAPGVYRENPIPGATQPMHQVLDPMARGASGATIVDLPWLLAE